MTYQYEPPDVQAMRNAYIEQRQQAQLPNIFQRGLELLGRPQAAVGTGLAELLNPGSTRTGRPLSGFMAGLTQEPYTPEQQAAGAPHIVRGGEDLLQTLGMGEGPGVQTPLGRLTTRGVLGLGAGIVTDPLSLIPWGRGAKALGDVAGVGATAAREAATGALPAIGEGVNVADEFAKLAQPTALASVAQRAADLPVVGPTFAKVMNAVSPRILAGQGNDVSRAFLSLQAAEGERQSMANAAMAPLRAEQHELPMQTALSDGRTFATADVVERPELAALAPANIQRYAQDENGLMNALLNRWNQIHDTLPPWLQDHFPIAGHPAAGVPFHPRYRIMEGATDRPLRVGAVVGGQKSFQLEREFPLQTTAMNEGYQYETPMAAVARRVNDMLSSINQMQFAKVLADQGIIQQGVTGAASDLATHSELATIGVPFLKDLWFQPEDAARLESLLSRGPNAALAPYAAIGGWSRALQAGFDLSHGVIQGIAQLAQAPQLWLKAQYEAIAAFKSPERMNQFLATPLAQKMAQETGIAIRQSGEGEYTTPLAGIAGKAIAPFQRMFEQFGNAARVYGAAAMYDTAKQAGKLSELGDHLNYMTGVLSLQGMGVSPTQQQVENALIFAPQYTRASLALVGNVLRGGYPQQQAIDSLANMIVFGSMWYSHLAEAAGQEPRLDPSKPDFMTVDVGGTRVGIGSNWTALIRFLGQLMTSPETGQIDPAQILRGDDKNPLLKFWRGRMAPIPSAVWDIAFTHEDQEGRPLENPAEIVPYLGTKFMPFAAQALITGQGTLLERGKLAASTGLGLRSFEAPYADQLDAAARDAYSKPYDQLLPQEQAQVQQNLKAEGRQIPQGNRYEGARAKAEAFDTRSQALETAAQQVQAGQITKEQFRQQLAKRGDTLAAQLDEIGKLTPQGQAKPMTAVETMRQEYLNKLRTPDEFGRTPFEAADEYLQSLPPEAQQYIKDTQEAGAYRLPPGASVLVQQLQAAREQLRPYWDISKTVMQQRGIWDEYQAMNPAQQVAFEKTPQYKAAERVIAVRKEQMRMRNPAVDQALVDWYGATPIRGRRR